MITDQLPGFTAAGRKILRRSVAVLGGVTLLHACSPLLLMNSSPPVSYESVTLLAPVDPDDGTGMLRIRYELRNRTSRSLSFIELSGTLFPEAGSPEEHAPLAVFRAELSSEVGPGESAVFETRFSQQACADAYRYWEQNQELCMANFGVRRVQCNDGSWWWDPLGLHLCPDVVSVTRETQ